MVIAVVIIVAAVKTEARNRCNLVVVTSVVKVAIVTEEIDITSLSPPSLTKPPSPSAPTPPPSSV